MTGPAEHLRHVGPNPLEEQKIVGKRRMMNIQGPIPRAALIAFVIRQGPAPFGESLPVQALQIIGPIPRPPIIEPAQQPRPEHLRNKPDHCGGLAGPIKPMAKTAMSIQTKNIGHVNSDKLNNQANAAAITNTLKNRPMTIFVICIFILPKIPRACPGYLDFILKRYAGSRIHSGMSSCGSGG